MYRTERLVVYKDRALNEDQGLVRPVLSIDDEGKFRQLDEKRFPSGILISKGYSAIEENYEESRLFIIKESFKDEQKTEEDGIDRYWAFGRDATPLPQNTLLPIISCKLPPIETGQLPEDIKAPRGLFFILDESEKKLYGPAQATSVANEAYQIMEAATTPKLSFGQDNLGVFDTEKLEDVLVTVNINGHKLRYLTSANELANRHQSIDDFISDRKLIPYFNKLKVGQNSKALSKKEADRLASSIADFEKIHRNASKKDGRLERLKNILDRYLNEADVGYQVVRDYFDTTAGKSFLTQYVEANKEKLLGAQISSFKEDISRQEGELNKNIVLIENKIKFKQNELDAINSRVENEKHEADKRIQEIKEEADEEIQQRMRSREQELQDEISALEMNRDLKSKDLAEVCVRLSVADDVAKMHEKEIYYRESNERLKAAARGYQEQLQDTDGLARRVSEYHVIGQVLKGGDVTKETRIEYLPIDFTTNVPSSAIDLIAKIRSYLDKDNGKSFSDIDLSNIMISLTQSFLTVLAGPPGVGKTSTIIRLAQSLKLGSPDDRKNFLYMPVSRGWVSSRDILGFHNSLTRSYQRARTGLYDFLCRDDDGTKALQLVLLDESNLSPMEHYWSEFLGMCDKEGRSRPIDTGIPHVDSRLLKVGNNVRFIATINHDSTTERLSPRLIDRVPVISFDHEDDLDFGYDTGDLILDGAVDYALLEKFFSCEDEELSNSHKNILDNIITTLGERDSNLGQSISISHRKRVAIANYCGAAIKSELMDPDTALDFALSQHILPHIEGYGSKFKNRITKLSEVLGKGYPRTSKHIERILASGNDFTGTYSFF